MVSFVVTFLHKFYAAFFRVLKDRCKPAWFPPQLTPANSRNLWQHFYIPKMAIPKFPSGLSNVCGNGKYILYLCFPNDCAYSSKFVVCIVWPTLNSKPLTFIENPTSSSLTFFFSGLGFFGTVGAGAVGQGWCRPFFLCRPTPNFSRRGVVGVFFF